jgi:hypothetical protein
MNDDISDITGLPLSGAAKRDRAAAQAWEADQLKQADERRRDRERTEWANREHRIRQAEDK